MFNLGSVKARNCDGVSRRALLRVGGLSLLGLNLPSVLAAQARAQARQPAAARRDVNCILLWMGGGASNIDTFDMKPDAPAEYRGEFRQIATNLPGVHVCEHLPRMSRHLDKICQIRSIAHRESGDHVAAVHYMLTGYPQRPDPSGQPANSVIYPCYGSVVNRELGWRNSLPPYVVLSGKLAPYTGAGYMGSAYNPLLVRNDPNAPHFAVEDVSIPTSVGVERTARRRRMLDELDVWRRRHDRVAEAVGERSQFYQQAYDLITSPAAIRAFRIDDEPARVRDRYGRHRYGQSALLARRLIEAGVRFVSVETSWWDTHVNNFTDLKNSRLPNLDQFYSALLEDLDQRGLLDNTLVIWMGEFGRTPTVNGQAGRDHWAYTNVVNLSGAGVRMGTVVGQTERRCERVAGTPHSTHDFAATIYQLLGIDATREYRGPDGRPHLLNYHGTPIAQALA
ncbi:MAG: DUF1501 domain-containing protein [Gemmataceae bacterium]|nr:DUF1501 domain-containing protein [Gemmataceae bacterium]